MWFAKERNALGGTRGAVLLRLRECDENRGTFGGDAASAIGWLASASLAGSSGTGVGCAVKDRFGLGRDLDLATLIESRIGFLLSEAEGGGGI